MLPLPYGCVLAKASLVLGMGTCRRRLLRVWFLFWFLMGFQLCASLNSEGAALLKFKETIDADPYGALVDWDEGSTSPCSWFGVECSCDGRVVALNLANLGLNGVLPAEVGKLMHMHNLEDIEQDAANSSEQADPCHNIFYGQLAKGRTYFRLVPTTYKCDPRART